MLALLAWHDVRDIKGHQFGIVGILKGNTNSRSRIALQALKIYDQKNNVDSATIHAIELTILFSKI